MIAVFRNKQFLLKSSWLYRSESHDEVIWFICQQFTLTEQVGSDDARMYEDIDALTQKFSCLCITTNEPSYNRHLSRTVSSHRWYIARSAVSEM